MEQGAEPGRKRGGGGGGEMRAWRERGQGRQTTSRSSMTSASTQGGPGGPGQFSADQPQLLCAVTG